MILDHFQGIPREAQAQALKQLEAGWKNADVFVILAPTGAGKSLISLNIAKWAHKELKMKTSIITPTKLLVDQYLDVAPRMHTIKNMQEYVCTKSEEQIQTLSCKRARELDDDKKFCPGCPYMTAVKKAHVMPYGVYNNWTYMAHRLFRDVLILDEGHLAVEMIRSLSAKKLWKFDYKYPNNIRSYSQLYNWVFNHPKRNTDSKLRLLFEELNSGKVHYLVEQGTDLYRGEECELLKLLPVDVSDQPPILWPHNKVKKLVFLSATMGHKDIQALGLDRRRVEYIEVGSPIPPANRPFTYVPLGNMSAKYQHQMLPKLINYIEEQLEKRQEAGLIHAPYSLARALQGAMSSNKRLLFHDHDNKKQVYEHFRKYGPSKGLVLVASGLYEGISLDQDAGRWQIITKVPYMNLGEPGYKWLAEKDPEAYAWLAIRLVVQAAGRISRGPTDFGETFITDTSFGRLYETHQELFPNYFKEAISA
jgi:Rad3-related DNA helicase